MTSLCRDCFAWSPAGPRCPVCGSPRVIAHAELADLSMAHMDCDAFYASVEKRDRPDLRDVPVIVGGGQRGVVTTCCYIARTYGVRSAMPMFKALKICPQAIVIPPDFSKYRTESRRIMDMVRALTPLVQPLSLDEAWIDLSGTSRLHGAPPAETLARLQKRIETEVGITVSVGLSANKFLAKIASELDKPRGFAVIGATEAEAFLAPRPVTILPGVGPVLAETLTASGYATIGHIARADPADLARRFGQNGLRLSALAHGRDTRPVDPDQVRKSISAETTFEADLTDQAALDRHLVVLADKVARQARGAGLAGRVVTLKLRTADFKILTRRRTLGLPTQTGRSILATGRELLAQELAAGARGRRFRLIGIGVTDLIEADQVEADFFDGSEARILASERTADDIRARFGPGAVTSAQGLGSKHPRPRE